MMKALNLGCGNDYRESTEEVSWINLDNGNCKVDVHFDLDKDDHLPFLDNEFDLVLAIQVLEHIEPKRFPELVREVYRILKDGGTFRVAVPHGLSDNFITDPTHKLHFSTRTFDYFVDGSQLRENGVIYGWGDIRFAHASDPQIDGNYSIIFNLRAIK